MKIKELIEELQKFDPETLVVVDGYEDGFHTPEKVRTILVHGPYEGKPYWDGEYVQEDSKGGVSPNKLPVVEAVYLHRYG